jgi:hypothetical protein
MAFGDDERTSSLLFVAASRLTAEGAVWREGDLMLPRPPRLELERPPPASPRFSRSILPARACS